MSEDYHDNSPSSNSELNDDWEEIDYALTSLRRRTFLLRTMSLAIFIGTVFSGLGWILFRLLQFNFTSALSITGIVLSCVLLLILFFERLSKRGDLLFQEISDELEWHVGITRGRTNTNDDGVRSGPDMKDRPTIRIRLVLREFVQAQELPLVPHKYGPGIYFGVNLLLFILNSALLARFSRF